MKLNKLILLGILVLAFVLRFYKLNTYPAFNADEAAIGYNAYSLIQTGQDEHGNSWPVHFQSFNDYKPGLYFYLVLPLVKVMGLNEWAVRIPGAFLGVLTVLAVYLLVNEMFPDRKVGLLSAFLLTISPWHIQYSRGGWETNVATFFITLGIWLFLKSLKNTRYLIFSFLAFVLSLYTYHAARVIVPLLGVGLFILFHKEIFKNIKIIFITLAFSGILLIPLVKDLTGTAGFSRAAGVGLFADPGPLSRINEQRGEHGNFTGLIPKLIHNKAVNYSLAFLSNWSKHFWGEFLFLSGDDIQRDKVPETGQLYLFQFPLLLFGLYFLIKSKQFKLILLWLVIAPVASALTFQSPHAVRAHNMVIPLTIISAIGLAVIFEKVKVIRINMVQVTGYGLIGVLAFWNFLTYEHMYWNHMAKEYPFSSQYGVKELVNYISTIQDNYQKIMVTNRYDQPYILFLFYLKYPPSLFQLEHQLTPRDNFGFSTVNNYNKYYFGPINFDVDKPNNPKSLIAGTNEDIPKEANIIKTIYGSNGNLYFKVVAN